jgi:signal transduction histidine kinase
VINAVDAMPDGGTLSARTFYDEEASVISIEIADTGPGIDPQDRDRIFHPFVTSKPKGTGLGLAICKQIIEQHEGSIRLDGNPGGGARFVVRVPLKAVRTGGAA